MTAVIGLCACSPQSLLLRAAADQLAGQGQADEEDLLLARDASAFYLKLSESVLRQTPGHLPLAEAVAGGFTQYAYAFIALEADRIESTDAKAAQRMRERAARLYARAKRHAMAALEQHRPVDPPHLGEQTEVLHVASADLEDVGILGHERHVLRRHDLRDDC